MIIGIDASVLAKSNAGISTYIRIIIEYLMKEDKDNIYYLYINKNSNISIPLTKNFIVKKYDAIVPSLYIRYKLHKDLIKDKVDLFWGPAHVLPKKRKEYKMVLTIHDLVFKKFKSTAQLKNRILLNLVCKPSIKDADKIIAISNSTKKDIIEEYKVNPKKIELIYNGYESHSVLPSKEQIENTKKKFNINNKFLLFISTIEPRKNIPHLIQAFDIYKEKNKSNYQLVIAGGLGWKYEESLEAVKKSKYSQDIIYTGFVSQEEKSVLYSQTELVLFVSLYEGFGFPVLEGLSYDKNVLTSNVSSMPEIGQDACYYVNNPNDPKEIAKMIDVAIKNTKGITSDKRKEQIGKFPLSKCAAHTYKLFKNLIGENE